MAAPMSNSGLDRMDAKRARRMAQDAAILALHHAGAIHYTQGPHRWDGIDLHKKAWRGEYPLYADCSAFVTWCIWNGLDHFHLPDCVNAEHWRAGFTGTMLGHGRHVSADHMMVADAILYGVPGTSGRHTAICVDARRKLVVSHGSEAGPFLLRWNYRSDVMAIRRYI